MSKKFAFLSVVFAGLLLLFTGCGDRDKELKSRVPASAEAALFIDAAKVRDSNAFKQAAGTEEFLEAEKELKEFGLSFDDFANRYIIFGSFKEKYAGAVIQSTKGNAGKFYDKILADEKVSKKDGFKLDKAQNIITFNDDGKAFYLQKISSDLLLFGCEITDSKKFSNDGKNIILKQIDLKSTVSGIALFNANEVPETENAAQFFPAIKKLKMISIDLKTPESKPVFAFSFTDSNAANEALGFTSLMFAMAAQNKPDQAQIFNKIERKVDNNTLRITFDTTIIDDIKNLKK